jgi:hypothetical protein
MIRILLVLERNPIGSLHIQPGLNLNSVRKPDWRHLHTVQHYDLKYNSRMIDIQCTFQFPLYCFSRISLNIITCKSNLLCGCP